ncbi:hypothetical protein PMAYCL1PPCAC_27286, partial [Pristionchus mayeri]
NSPECKAYMYHLGTGECRTASQWESTGPPQMITKEQTKEHESIHVAINSLLEEYPDCLDDEMERELYEMHLLPVLKKGRSASTQPTSTSDLAVLPTSVEATASTAPTADSASTGPSSPLDIDFSPSTAIQDAGSKALPDSASETSETATELSSVTLSEMTSTLTTMDKPTFTSKASPKDTITPEMPETVGQTAGHAELLTTELSPSSD